MLNLAPRQRSLKNWWRATYQTPSKHDLKWGTISASMQSGVITSAGFAISYALSNLFGVDMPTENTPLIIGGLTFAYGALLGIWNDFYQNFRNRGTKLARDVKNGVIKGSFYILVSIVASGVAQDVSLFDFSFDMNAFGAQITNAFGQLSQVELQDIYNKVTGSAEYISGMSWLAMALFSIRSTISWRVTSLKTTPTTNKKFPVGKIETMGLRISNFLLGGRKIRPRENTKPSIGHMKVA